MTTRRYLQFVEDVGQDVRHGLRIWRNSPAFAIVAVLTLGVAIGANTAIFSVIDAFMLRKLPVDRPEQLVMAWTMDERPMHSDYTFYQPMFVRFRDLSTSFVGVSSIFHIRRSNVRIGGPDGAVDPNQVEVGMASGNFFSVLGVNAAVGRTLTDDDDRVQGKHPVVVISYDYWRRRFRLAPDVLQRTLSLNGVTYTIVGVMPRGFGGDVVGAPTDVWFPFMMVTQVMPEVPSLNGHPRRVIARLKPGVSIAQAQAASTVLYQQLLREDAGSNLAPRVAEQIAQQRLVLEPGARGYSPQRESFVEPLAILGAAVGLLLLIACANVANLLLARSAARRREMATRAAIGAGRGRLARQMLAESALLAAASGVVGSVFASWGASALAAAANIGPASFGDTRIVGTLDIRLDGATLLFTSALCVLATLLCGLMPVFRGSKIALVPSLNARDEDGSVGSRRFGVSSALVVVQVAVSVLLLVGAGLLVRTLRNLTAQDLGFNREHLLIAWTMPGQTGRQGPELLDFWQRVQERLSSLPGVVSATAMNAGILTGRTPQPTRPSDQMIVEGMPQKQVTVQAARLLITPRFFQTMGIPLVAGREFTERDAAGAPRGVIINESQARFFFGDVNPVGRRVRFPWDRTTMAPNPPVEIVGVARDYVGGTPRAAGQPAFSTYFFYRDPSNAPRWIMCAFIRVAGNPLSVADRVRKELRAIEPTLPLLRLETADEQLTGVLAQDRLLTVLASVFGVVAALLACLGLYGLLSYAVTRRRREIGIRLALGAAPTDVRAAVLKQSAGLVFLGLTVGLPASLAATRVIVSRLYGVRPADPSAFAAAVMFILAVCAIATFVPASRASQVDPMTALRCE